MSEWYITIPMSFIWCDSLQIELENPVLYISYTHLGNQINTNSRFLGILNFFIIWSVNHTFCKFSNYLWFINYNLYYVIHIGYLSYHDKLHKLNTSWNRYKPVVSNKSSVYAESPGYLTWKKKCC